MTCEMHAVCLVINKAGTQVTRVATGGMEV